MQNAPATVDGMLGGHAYVSPVDVQSSTDFINEFLEVKILEIPCFSLGEQGCIVVLSWLFYNLIYEYYSSFRIMVDFLKMIMHWVSK